MDATNRTDESQKLLFPRSTSNAIRRPRQSDAVEGPQRRIEIQFAQSSSAVCRNCGKPTPSALLGGSNNLLDQVVTGSATPAGASQWSFCRTGSRASVPGSRGTTSEPGRRDPSRRPGSFFLPVTP